MERRNISLELNRNPQSQSREGPALSPQVADAFWSKWRRGSSVNQVSCSWEVTRFFVNR